MKTPARPKVVVTIPSGWAPTMFGAFIAAITPYLLVQALTGLAYSLQAGNVWLAEVGWSDAMALGAALWAAGYGTPMQVGGTVVTLIPTGLSLAYLAFTIHSLRRWLGPNPVAVWFALPIYPLTVWLLALMTARSYKLPELVAGAVLISFIAVVVSAWRSVGIAAVDSWQDGAAQGANRSWFATRKQQVKHKLAAFWGRQRTSWQGRVERLKNWDWALAEEAQIRAVGGDRRARTLRLPIGRIPVSGWIADGIHAGVSLLAIGAGVMLAATLAQIALSWDNVSMIGQLTGVNTIEHLILIIAEVAYLPTFMIWALAWCLGAGFATGTDALLSPHGSTPGPIPALPVLGALPDYLLHYWPLAVLVGVVIGAALWGYSGYARGQFAHHLGVGLVAILLATAVGAAGAYLAAGATGPGRMATWGPDLGHFMKLWLGAVAVPYLLVFSAAHPRVRGLVTGRARTASYRPALQAGTPLAAADRTETDVIALTPGQPGAESPTAAPPVAEPAHGTDATEPDSPPQQ